MSLLMHPSDLTNHAKSACKSIYFNAIRKCNFLTYLLDELPSIDWAFIIFPHKISHEILSRIHYGRVTRGIGDHASRRADIQAKHPSHPCRRSSRRRSARARQPSAPNAAKLQETEIIRIFLRSCFCFLKSSGLLACLPVVLVPAAVSDHCFGLTNCFA